MPNSNQIQIVHMRTLEYGASVVERILKFSCLKTHHYLDLLFYE